MRHFLLAVALFNNAMLFGQSSCEIWQWTGTDSANKILATTKQFDKNGNTVHEKLTGFLFEPDKYGYGGTEGTSIYVYRDTCKTAWYFIGLNGDSTRKEFQYDDKGNLVREISSRRSFVSTDTVHSGMFTINAVSVDSNDNTWVKRDEWNYRYDSLGRKSSVEITYVNGTGKDYYQWIYNEQGRVGIFIYTVHGITHFADKIVYTPRQEFVSRTHYDEKGKEVKKPGKKDPAYMQKQVFVRVKDEQGRIIEERNETRDRRLIDRVVTSYNTDGKIAKTIWYDAEGNVLLTHVYVYK